MAEQTSDDPAPAPTRPDESVWAELRDLLKASAEREQLQAERLAVQKPEWRLDKLLETLGRIGPAAIGLATALVLLAVLALGVGTIVAAAREHSVVVEALSVPPSLQNDGLTGQVAASQLLDRLQFMQQGGIMRHGNPFVVEPAGQPIKVAVSSATLSLDEVYVYLRSWIGHDTFVSGEIVRLPDDLAALELVVRVGVHATCSARGRRLDALYDTVAGCVLNAVDPRRYAQFLVRQSLKSLRDPVDPHAACDALPELAGVSVDVRLCRIFRTLTAASRDGGIQTRAWALGEIGFLLHLDEAKEYRGMFRCADPGCRLPGAADAIAYDSRALALEPNAVLALGNRIEAEHALGHAEAEFRDNLALARLYARRGGSDLDARAAQWLALANRATIEEMRDDVYDGAALRLKQSAYADGTTDRDNAWRDYVHDEDALHAPWAHRKVLEWIAQDAESDGNSASAAVVWGTLAALAVSSDDRARDQAAERRDRAAPAVAKPFAPSDAGFDPVIDYPDLARQLADERKFAAADALVSKMPPDCYDCVMAHAYVLSAEGRLDDARTVLAQGARLAPSLPAAFVGGGRTCMRLGKWDCAVAGFDRALKASPQDADAMELKGEALIAHDRSDLAVAPLSQAARTAPLWGHLHLKWGEALLWSGDAQGAAKQFALAAALYLTPSDRATVLRLKGSHG